MAPKIMNGISAAETKTMEQFKMAASLMDLTPVALSWRSENLIITDYTPASLVEQLTLLEQVCFGPQKYNFFRACCYPSHLM